MGNKQSCGFGVLNKSNIQEINIGLSMAGTHYYENRVENGKIFYRWPGAVHYTVYALARSPDGKNDISDGQCAWEITKSSIIGISTAGAVIFTAATAAKSLAVVEATQLLITTGINTYVAADATLTASEEVISAFEKSKLYCEVKGCYGGGRGSWYVVEGGPYYDNGHNYPQDLTIREVDQDYVFQNGNFTDMSHRNFHTEEGLRCTTNCTSCNSQ